MIRRFFPAIVILCVFSGAVFAQQIRVAARATSAGGVTLEWNGVGTNTGYAVSETRTLSDATWRYVSSVDQWPSARTNCVLTVDDGVTYTRVHAVRRGHLRSSLLLGSALASEINLLLFLQGLPPTATNDVAVYKLVYETFDHRGLSTLASGALVIPTSPGAGSYGPLVCFQHGTVLLKNDAPSSAGTVDQNVGAVMAGEGYIVALPDYLGLGSTSPGLHPYLHARSAAVAAVDMLRATRAFLTDYGNIQPNGQVFITGYSQGGHATLALQRELETHHASEFPLTASAPMAGPYDLSGSMAAPITQPVEYEGREYIPYLLFAYDAVYGIYASPSDVLASPYDSTLPPLFDGMHSGGEVDAAMPRVPRDIFNPEWLADFTNDPANPLRVALEANDLYRDWTPQAPMHLYHCSGDEIVPFSNSVVAFSNFVARGADVQLFDKGDYSHADGALPCLLAAKAWFDSLR